MLWIPGALAETTTTTTEEVIEAAAEVVEETVNLNIGIGEACMYTLVGFLVVFVVLFVIIGAIVLTSKLVGGMSKKPAAKEPHVTAAPVPAAPVAAPVAAPGSCGELKLYNVSDKDAAMIMAIVADEMKTPLNELRFISIKEIA